MQQKVIEIIEFLISEINQLQEPHVPDIDVISKKLLEKGYTEKDIQEAVEWIFEFMDDESATHKNLMPGSEETPNIRVLSSLEQKIFSNKAHGFIIQIQTLRLVNPVQLEQIIDRCMMMGLDQISEEDVKAVFMQIVLGKKIWSAETDAVFHQGNETIH